MSHSNSLKGGNIETKVVDIIKDCIIMNCDARIEMSEDANYEPQGNGTEVGMLKFLMQNGYPVQDMLT